MDGHDAGMSTATRFEHAELQASLRYYVDVQ